ncbi:MAG: 1-acyl-sn-glycerol-3-phosphate acyltransferase [Pseudomonadota bacterium]
MIEPNQVSLRDYRVSFAMPDDPWAFRHFFRSLEALFGAWSCARLSRRAHAEMKPGESIWGAYLRLADAEAEAIGETLPQIPRDRAAVFVANHPTGIPDAAVLGHLIDRHIRSDALFITFRPLAQLPSVADRSIPIDLPSPSGRFSRKRARNMARSFATARQHLNEGGAVVAFPAGPDGTCTPSGTYVDGPWQKATFKLAAETGAVIVPVFIDAQMSRLRRACRRLSPLLYHAAAAHEVRNMKKRRIEAVFGQPIDAAGLASETADGDVASVMRETTYALAAA